MADVQISIIFKFKKVFLIYISKLGFIFYPNACKLRRCIEILKEVALSAFAQKRMTTVKYLKD